MTLTQVQDSMRDRSAGCRTGRAQGQNQRSAGRQGAAQGFTDTLREAGGNAETKQVSVEEVPRTLRQKMQDMIAKLNEKGRNGGGTAQSFAIGAQSFTIEEWDRMMERIDAAQEALREEQRIRQGQRLQEKAQKGVAEIEWMDNRYAEEGVTQKDAASLTVEEILEKLLTDDKTPKEEESEAQERKENEALQKEEGGAAAVLI